MKFLKPNSVSGEILNLIDEANEKVVIVSPYCKFDKWYRLVNKIQDLKSRNIAIEFYIRENEQESYDQIVSLGIKPICIPNLHSKLYLNEKYGIVTSMNLLLSSEINSIEVGYKTETKEELKELFNFYETYLNKKGIDSTFNWLEDLYNKLSEKFNAIRINEYEENVEIKTSSNTYKIFIYNNKGLNKLRISGILSGKEFDYAKTLGEDILDNIKLEFINGGKRHYDSLWGTFEIDLKSSNINEIKSSDSIQIITPIFDFINKVEEIKEYCYMHRKEL
jgi:hypothetical protein